jgi:hypothetical protein
MASKNGSCDNASLCRRAVPNGASFERTTRAYHKQLDLETLVATRAELSSFAPHVPRMCESKRDGDV